MSTVLLSGALLAAAGTASGHSLLLEAVPAPGAALRDPPREVRLRFNGRVEPRLSGLRLVDGQGRARALPLALVDGAPVRVRAGLPELGPGRYHVDWHVLSVDGHVAGGRFSFSVAP